MTDLTQEELGELSKAREERCKPVVLEFLASLLKHDLLLSDTNYIQALVKQELEVMFKTITYQHFNEIYETVQRSLEHSVRQAQEHLWGSTVENVKLKKVDTILKQNAKVPKNK